jgi:hypothetical protein
VSPASPSGGKGKATAMALPCLFSEGSSIDETVARGNPETVTALLLFLVLPPSLKNPEFNSKKLFSSL